MATKKTTSRATTRRSSSQRSGRRRTRTTAASRSTRPVRSRPGLPTTIGTALGTLVVTILLDLSWPARIGLVVAVLVIGLAYVVWRHRAEIAAGADRLEPGGTDVQPPEPAG